MDYKYIEQLLQRYWLCETSVEEERILRDFFRQKDIPENLRRYHDLFAYEPSNNEETLGSDFDARVLAKVEEPKVKATRVPLIRRFRPFYKAAAIVAIVITLGNAAQHSFRDDSSDATVDYNYDSYRDTYTDPQVALEQASSALRMVSDGLRADSVSKDTASANSHTVTR